MNYAKITGVGSHLPTRIMPNSELEKSIDTSDEWIRSRTGIAQRHIVTEDQGTCDLAEQAARNAIKNAAISIDEIDLIIVATTTPDRIFPSTACLLQQRLGVYGCAAFDVQAVCTGFIYALGVADKFIRTNTARCALVVGVDTMSRLIDWQDRTTCVLFGDGAGAVIMQASKEQGILSTHLRADGRFQALLHVPYGIGSRQQDNHKPYVLMQGNEVFRIAVKTLGHIVDKTLATHNLSIKDIDWLIPHQANIRIINAIAKKLALPIDKVILTIQKHGNTSAASIPMALDIAARDGRIKNGDMLMFAAFGGGFTWGSALIQY